MSDDNKKPDENAGSWAMPEPVFRSTEGYTPRSAMSGAQDDIPTEPGFSDEDDVPTAIPNAAASDSDSGSCSMLSPVLRNHPDW